MKTKPYNFAFLFDLRPNIALQQLGNHVISRLQRTILLAIITHRHTFASVDQHRNPIWLILDNWKSKLRTGDQCTYKNEKCSTNGCEYGACRFCADHSSITPKNNNYCAHKNDEPTPNCWWVLPRQLKSLSTFWNHIKAKQPT